MDHLEILSLADEHRAGRLDAATRAAVDGHLAACADCRAVYAAWDPSASAPWMAGRVLAILRPVRALALPGWLAPVAASLALLLLLSAFWHPERTWLRADDAAYAYSAADAAAPLGGLR